MVIDLKSSQNKPKNRNCEVMDVVTNLIAVVIVQYIHISNYHIVHVRLTQCCMSIRPHEAGKGGNTENPPVWRPLGFPVSPSHALAQFPFSCFHIFNHF